MAKKFLPIEVPEELVIFGWGAEDSDGVVDSKIDNLDTDFILDPTNPDDTDLIKYSDRENGDLVFKYKLVSIGTVNKTSSVKWKSKK